MGKSLEKIIYSIKEELSGYIITDDTLYDDEYIKDKIMSAREAIIKDLYRNKLLNESYYQRLCCLEVNCVEAACNFEGTPIYSGDSYNVIEIPSLIKGVGWDNIINLGTTDLNIKLQRVTFDGFMSSDGALYTSTYPIYTIVDNKALLKNIPLGTKFLCGIMLLYDPTEACNWEDNKDYPIDDSYKLEMLVKKDILSVMGIVGDEINDGRDMKGVLLGYQNRQRQSNESEGE
jgi:hypothetical protein